jgi:hypothetical protein
MQRRLTIAEGGNVHHGGGEGEACGASTVNASGKERARGGFRFLLPPALCPSRPNPRPLLTMAAVRSIPGASSTVPRPRLMHGDENLYRIQHTLTVAFTVLSSAFNFHHLFYIFVI